MNYIFFANIIAGIHVALMVYFLAGWLIPFTSMRKRALSVCIIGGIILFFHLYSICPLTLWEYQLRLKGGDTVQNVWMIERLSTMTGLSTSASVLNVVSWSTTLGITFFATIMFCLLQFRKKIIN